MLALCLQNMVQSRFQKAAIETWTLHSLNEPNIVLSVKLERADGSDQIKDNFWKP